MIKNIIGLHHLEEIFRLETYLSNQRKIFDPMSQIQVLVELT